MRTLWLLLLALACLLPASAQDAPGKAKKVLIIGIDGCRPDALKAARTPNIDKLVEEGAYSDRAQTGDITVSGPGWSSMLTGVWRDKHGVRDNGFEGSNYPQYPHFFRRLRQAQPKAVTVSVVHWKPIADRIVADADVNLSFPKDAEVTAKAAEILAGRDPDAVFVHLDEVDGAGHRFGFHPGQKEYLAAIEAADVAVGRLVAVLKQRKTYAAEDWLILLSTDHGGTGKGHGQNIPEHRTIFFIASGPSAGRGVIEPAPGIVDVAATALAHLGVEIDPRWGLDGKAVGLK